MERELYIALKNEIKSNLPEIKTVGLWNNQFENEKEENPFLYPCVFIEMQVTEFRELTNGVQQFDMILTTHLGFESFKDEDLDILRLKQDLFKVVNRFRHDTFSRLLRVQDRPNYSHSNLQVFETDYRTTGKDFATDLRPSKDVELTPSFIPIIVQIDEL